MDTRFHGYVIRCEWEDIIITKVVGGGQVQRPKVHGYHVTVRLNRVWPFSPPSPCFLMYASSTMKKKNVTQVERHLETMFEQALYSDLSLVFLHPMFPLRMRFDVHQAIVSQAPFFKQLLDNQHLLDHEHQQQQQPEQHKVNTAEGRSVMTLNINMLQALLQRKFVLTPFQHIIRRKWQRPHESNSSSDKAQQQPLFTHILASHVRYALQWMYCNDKDEFFEQMEEDDTLRVLAIAILFQLDDLAHACAERYTTYQLSMFTIMRDLEHICQLPRDHAAYLQLRDASLRLLLRFGPDNPEAIAELPVDYMADVLNADLLYVHSEYERYCLLRDVLSEFMLSVGEIHWTPQGPVDQDHKRLSGFVKPMRQQQQITTPQTPLMTAVKARKRKRIPSQELAPPPSSSSIRHQRTTRLSFSATVPFQTLIEDASSGGVIDKATVLSYLLRNTINYSNMAFGQLTNVRADGIVDEGIVFRALWQRMALQRIIFPDQQVPSQQLRDAEALDEYFDVDSDRRHQILLGVPKYRFCVSIQLPSPNVANGWVYEEPEPSSQIIETVMESSDDSSEQINDNEGEMYEDEELDRLLENEEGVLNATTEPVTPAISESSCSPPTDVIWKKTCYSDTKEILGKTYRVRVDAQNIAGRLLHMGDDEQDYDDILLCRFGLDTLLNNDTSSQQQRLDQDQEKSSQASSSPPQEEKTPVPSKRPSREPKIRYSIYCLNRHQHITENDRVSDEDRVMIPVSEQSKDDPNSPWTGSCTKVRMDGYDKERGILIDLVVVLELTF